MREFSTRLSKYSSIYRESSTRLWMALAFIAGVVMVLVLAQVPVLTINISGQPQKYHPALPASPESNDFTKPGGDTDSNRPAIFNNYELVYAPFETVIYSG
jgi:hypothetical protein